MIYDLRNESIVPSFKKRVEECISKGYTVEIIRKSPQRSLAQNSYLHLILAHFACEYGCSIDEAKIDFFKRTCNKDLFEEPFTNKQGKQLVRLRSSSALTTAEMTTAIERFRNWSSSVGIYLPAPNEKEFLMHVLNEMETNATFL